MTTTRGTESLWVAPSLPHTTDDFDAIVRIPSPTALDPKKEELTELFLCALFHSVVAMIEPRLK